MQDIFEGLQEEDFAFLAGLLYSNINLTDNIGLRRTLTKFSENSNDEEIRDELVAKFRHEIRYTGSSDVAYLFRWMRGKPPGVTLKEVFHNAAKTLDVKVNYVASEREMASDIVVQYATKQFSSLPKDKQQEMLEQLGVDKDKAASFVVKSAGVFSIPVAISAFNVIIVEGLIKRIIFGTIARIIGKTLANKLFLLIVGRLPWWVGWIGPAAWTASVSWTFIDILGPAMRKTVPVTLFLGICALQLDESAGEVKPGD